MPKPSISRGVNLECGGERVPSERLDGRILAYIMLFLMTLFTVFKSTVNSLTKRVVEVSSQNTTNTEDEVSGVGDVESEVVSSVMKRLGELEDKVDTLNAKPSQMPYEKEELLNAAVCRVDALEAELIATKRALHEALMRQEELLAY
ncbi:hypothetical protein LXL04_021064, partial [Taraxacum kok-saghyz]